MAYEVLLHGVEIFLDVIDEKLVVHLSLELMLGSFLFALHAHTGYLFSSQPLGLHFFVI
jgi:hypothetical protein